MEEKELHKITAFDTLFTTNQIQILKILLTYLAPSSRKGLAIYIKLLELRYTIAFFDKHPHADILHAPDADNSDKFQIFDEILPLCSPSEQEKLQKMRSMYQNFENMQEMMQIVQMMQEMFPEGNSPLSSFMGGGDGQIDMSQLFHMFHTEE
ncbi:MAG: hypothetical protein NC081_08930 [Roseburia sp.]|nr:hypothetical protein [Roseburia sp.]